MKVLSAKFAGFCQNCKRKFPAGTEILWGASEGSQHNGSCPSCADCTMATGHADGCPQGQPTKGVYHRGVYFRAKAQDAAASPTFKEDRYPTLTDIDLSDIEVGGRGTSYYAVPFDGEGAQEDHFFVRIDKPTKGKWEGFIFVKWVYGEVERTIGRQWPGETFRFLKGEERFDFPVNTLWSSPEMYKALYGQLIGKCGNCHKRLTDAESRRLGIGPDCRSRLRYYAKSA